MFVLKRLLCIWTALCALCLWAAGAMADEAGVLTESELNEWVVKTLRQSAAAQPLNAPVGEEARTPDGYAFLYDFATLYYDKPVLDDKSVLQAIALTDEQYPGPRGIGLNALEGALISAYGWQNTDLHGDGAFAAFYRLDELPRAAYWSWAQLGEGGGLNAVQCAIHVGSATDRYTDTGVRYTLEEGFVTGVMVYGLDAFISEAEVRSNLSAVQAAEQAQGYDHDELLDMAADAPASDAAPFAADDLAFSGIDLRTLTPDTAAAQWGAPVSQRTEPDENGDTILNATWDGVELIWVQKADGTGYAESLYVSTQQIEGPRGLRTGDAFADTVRRFASEGGFGVLYGTQQSPLAVASMDGSQLRLSYTTEDGAYRLQAAFEQDALTEWQVYAVPAGE